MSPCSQRSVRLARLEDAPALLPLIKAHAAFEKGRASISLSELERLLGLSEAPSLLFVSEAADGGLNGYAALTFDYALWSGGCFGHLDCLFLSEAARGQGVGAALLARVKEVAEKRGAIRLEWQTPDWNVDAARFYRREGAQETAKRRFSLALGEGR